MSLLNKSMKITPRNPDFAFIRYRRVAFILSLICLIGAVAAFAARGLNFGIDFRGGTLIEIAANAPIDIAALRGRLAKLPLGEAQIQEFGKPTDALIRIGEAKGATDTARDLSGVAMVRAELAGDFTIRRVEIVGPQVSAELIRAGTLAVILAVAAMLIYIWFRFEWQFSLGAVAALVHDVVLTIGVFAALQLDFNLSIVAALLTIVGYSMNDTVVVYDRVRENLRKFKKMPLGDLLNLSINGTLARTIMTSVTTLLALLALYFLGGEVIRGFTFAMIWGVLVGTYSSIFVAAPLLLTLSVKRDWSPISGQK